MRECGTEHARVGAATQPTILLLDVASRAGEAWQRVEAVAGGGRSCGQPYVVIRRCVRSIRPIAPRCVGRRGTTAHSRRGFLKDGFI